MPSIAANQARRAQRFSRHRVTHLLRLLLALVILLTACSGVPSNRVHLIDGQRWEASLLLPYEAGSGTLPLGADDSVDLETFKTDVQQALEPLGVRSAWTMIPGGVSLDLSGDGGAPQIGRILYGALVEVIRPFTPGARVNLVGAVETEQEVTFTLESSLTSGYAWQVAEARGLRLLAAGDFQPTTPATGAPLRQTLVFEATYTGEANLTLVYRRPWEEPGTGYTREITLSAPRMDQLSDLTYPDRKSDAAAASPEPQVEQAVPLSLSPAESVASNLPASFDWHALGKLPPVRNQGSCGSCWAFATVGVLESAIMIRDNVANVDLSEQFLVSCNQDRWGCNGGGTAHDYHAAKVAANQATPGAVLESAYPYTGADSACTLVSTHPYQITTWANLPGTDPVDVDALKQAIYQYGPIKASVCAGPAFQAYRGGLFATDESQICGGWTNHAIILTGWDDTQGPNGAWILRNSWGPYWGTGGYMLIDRRVSGIGRNASYVIYNGSSILTTFTDQVYLPVIAAGEP